MEGSVRPSGKLAPKESAPDYPLISLSGLYSQSQGIPAHAPNRSNRFYASTVSALKVAPVRLASKHSGDGRGAGRRRLGGMEYRARKES